VTKRGNPQVRAALVECAWRMVRFQPQYAPVQKRLAVLAKGSRAMNNPLQRGVCSQPNLNRAKARASPL
jgi:hypothetical protein